MDRRIFVKSLLATFASAGSVNAAIATSPMAAPVSIDQLYQQIITLNDKHASLAKEKLVEQANSVRRQATALLDQLITMLRNQMPADVDSEEQRQADQQAFNLIDQTRTNMSRAEFSQWASEIRASKDRTDGVMRMMPMLVMMDLLGSKKMYLNASEMTQWEWFSNRYIGFIENKIDRTSVNA